MSLIIGTELDIPPDGPACAACWHAIDKDDIVGGLRERSNTGNWLSNGDGRNGTALRIGVVGIDVDCIGKFSKPR